MSTMKCNPCCDNLKGRKAEFLILTIWLLRFRCIHLIAQHFHIPSRWFSPARDLKQHRERRINSVRIENLTRELQFLFTRDTPEPLRNHQSPKSSSQGSSCTGGRARAELLFPPKSSQPWEGTSCTLPGWAASATGAREGFLHRLKSGTRRACLLAQLSAVTKNPHMFAHDIRNPTSPWNSAFNQHLCLQTARLGRRFLNIRVFCTTPTLPLLAALRSGTSLHVLLSYFYSYFVHSPSWSLYQARLWLQLILLHLF